MLALCIEDLHKTYSNGVNALNGISFSVQQGDFFALLGPNAAGKSTLIGVITSLIAKSTGRVMVFGYDLDINPQAAKACIGLVPQEFNFNPVEKVQSILIKQAGYYGIDKKPALERSTYLLNKLALEDKCSEQARNLSSGQKRRLMIARALMHEPRLLILDEPTAGVDIETRRYLWNLLREINTHGTTIILTTHYLEEAESLCRNIAIIDHGSLITHSPLRMLVNKLHTEALILHLDQSLNDIPRLTKFSCKMLDASTLEVYLAKEQSVNELFMELGNQGVIVLSMRNKTNRLEELFLSIISESNGRGLYT